MCKIANLLKNVAHRQAEIAQKNENVRKQQEKEKRATIKHLPKNAAKNQSASSWDAPVVIISLKKEHKNTEEKNALANKAKSITQEINAMFRFYSDFGGGFDYDDRGIKTVSSPTPYFGGHLFI